jgi:hypothetical protein
MEIWTQIQWLAGVVGGVIYFGIGALWYGPLFGKAWMKEKGMGENPEPPKPVLFIITVILQMIVGCSLLIFISLFEIGSSLSGMLMGLYISLGFVATTVGVNGVYNNMSLKLFAIDAGYHVIGFTAAGAFIGWWV